MDLFKLISKIKSKKQEPNYYSLLFSIDLGVSIEHYMHTCIEYRLEAAVALAKKEIMKAGVDSNSIKLKLWRLTPVKEIIEIATDTGVEQKIKQTKKKLNKNKIMNDIIQYNDRKLFENNKDLFDTNECKLINDSLKKRS